MAITYSLSTIGFTITDQTESKDLLYWYSSYKKDKKDKEDQASRPRARKKRSFIQYR